MNEGTLVVAMCRSMISRRLRRRRDVISALESIFVGVVIAAAVVLMLLPT